MNIELKSHHYNYYNIKGRYTPAEKEKADWVKRYENQVTDRVEASNSNPDSEKFQAYIKLEQIYYDKGVANRARYSNYDDLVTALGRKYLFGNEYKSYNYSERHAMYENELNMTLFGHCSNFVDPRLGGPVYAETDEETQSFNRLSVNNQIKNILTKGGIDLSALNKCDISFCIDPYDYRLTILGIDDDNLRSSAEILLNSNDNSKELFFHIFNSLRNSGANISDKSIAKYRTFHEMKNVGLNFSDFTLRKDGFYNNSGENILDAYKNALKNSSSVPAQFKGAAYDVFAEKIEKLSAGNFTAIPDLTLVIGYKNGELYDKNNSDVMENGFDTLA